MNNPELDGIPLSEFEISMIRIERSRVKFVQEREAKRKECLHTFTTYLGHGHNDEAYECKHCGEVKFV